MADQFWAICDTDGQRHEPQPLARKIFATQQEAMQHAAYCGFNLEHYPVLPVLVDVKFGIDVERE